jgi:ADP-heptose:LPS heptosyltransferase
MKILVIRFSSIGDIVLTTPILRCIKTQMPHAQIHYLTKTKFQTVLIGNPYIDQLHLLEGDIQPVVLNLLKEKFDVVIDLHNNLRTRYVKALLRQAFDSRVETYTVNKLNFKKWSLTTFKINLLPDKSIVERYFDTVKKLGIKNDGQGLDYVVPTEEEIKKDDLPMSHSLGFVACSIGGQHATKKMPLQQWQKLCESLAFPIVLLGGPEDAEFATELCNIDPIKIYNACGKFSLNESADIIKRARFVISHDTGLMHIAAAFKKPIISIWGNTVPELGMFPYYGYNNLSSNIAPNSYIIENKQIKCRPCSKIGYNACPKKHFNCMNQIDIQQIVNISNQLIKAAK